MDETSMKNDLKKQESAKGKKRAFVIKIINK